jgi:hypothetical protein
MLNKIWGNRDVHVFEETLVRGRKVSSKLTKDHSISTIINVCMHICDELHAAMILRRVT